MQLGFEFLNDLSTDRRSSAAHYSRLLQVILSRDGGVECQHHHQRRNNVHNCGLKLGQAATIECEVKTDPQIVQYR